MSQPRLPRRQALIDELNDAGWGIVARGGLRIALRDGTAVRINAVTGEVQVHGHGWSVTFDADVPDHVVIAAASSREPDVAARTASREEAARAA